MCVSDAHTVRTKVISLPSLPRGSQGSTSIHAVIFMACCYQWLSSGLCKVVDAGRVGQVAAAQGTAMHGWRCWPQGINAALESRLVCTGHKASIGGGCPTYHALTQAVMPLHVILCLALQDKRGIVAAIIGNDLAGIGVLEPPWMDCPCLPAQDRSSLAVCKAV